MIKNLMENRYLLPLLIILILVAGVSAAVNLPRLEDPRLTLRNVLIISAFPGASAERVEALVTEPLEETLETVNEIKKIESTSRRGVSILAVEFKDKITRKTNEQVISKIRDKVQAVTLPVGALVPVVDDQRGASAFGLLVAIKPIEAIDKNSISLNLLNRLAEDLQQRFLLLPGTEYSEIFGGVREQITIQVDPWRLAKLGLSIGDLAEKIQAFDPKVASGEIHGSVLQLTVNLQTAFDSAVALETLPIGQDGEGLVYLADLTVIKRSFQTPPAALAWYQGEAVILLAARIDRNTQIDQWAKQAKDLLKAWSPSPGVEAVILFDQSRYTKERLWNLAQNLALAVLIVALVVMLFMGISAGLLVASALPLSVAAAVFALSFFDTGIHQMSMFGLIIAMGLLIDNAIIVVSEIRKARQAGLSPLAAVQYTVNYLKVPLFAATATTILGFMPIFLLDGNVGDFIRSIAISVILALIASWLLALTVIAVLAALWLPMPKTSSLKQHDDLLSNLLRFSFRFPRLIVLFFLAIPLVAFLQSQRLPVEFFPSADRDMFQIQVFAPDGSSLAQTSMLVKDIDQWLRQQAGVVQSYWLTGASMPSVYYNQIQKEDNNPSYAQGIVEAQDVVTTNRLLTTLQMQLSARFPQALIVVKAFGQGPPIDAPVVLRLLGENLNDLIAAGEHIQFLISDLPAITFSRSTLSRGEASIGMQLSAAALSWLQLTPAAVAQQLAIAFSASQDRGLLLEDVVALPLVIESQSRATVAALRDFPMVSPSGWLPLHVLGEMQLASDIRAITRLNNERINEIQVFLWPGEKSVSVNAEILARLAKQPLPGGVRLEVGGDSDQQREALGKLATYLPVLVILMAGILILTFQSFILAGFVFLVALLSVSLGFIALVLSGYPLGFNPILGSLGLLGVAINGAIMVLSAIRQTPAARAGEAAAIIQATLLSTRHILSTSLTTVLGFLPLLYFSGGQFWPPLAVMLAGGVGFSVILALWLTPVFYYWLGKNGWFVEKKT